MKIKKFNESNVSRETHKELYDLQTIVSNITNLQTNLQDIIQNEELKSLALELDKAARKLDNTSIWTEI